MHDIQQAQKYFYDCRNQPQASFIGYEVLLSTKNLNLLGICKLQVCFIGPFQAISTGPGTYCLDLLPSMAAIHPWFNTSLLKPAVPQPARGPAMEDNSY